MIELKRWANELPIRERKGWRRGRSREACWSRLHRRGGFAGLSAACAGPLSSAPRAGRRTHRRRALAATFRAKFANSIALIRCPSSLARCWLGERLAYAGARKAAVRTTALSPALAARQRAQPRRSFSTSSSRLLAATATFPFTLSIATASPLFSMLKAFAAAGAAGGGFSSFPTGTGASRRVSCRAR